MGSSKDGGQARSELTEIDSRMFGTEDVTFLTGNNSVLLAHQGSTVTLSCRLTKTPNFGMVRFHQGSFNKMEDYNIAFKILLNNKSCKSSE